MCDCVYDTMSYILIYPYVVVNSTMCVKNNKQSAGGIRKIRQKKKNAESLKRLDGLARRTSWMWYG